MSSVVTDEETILGEGTIDSPLSGNYQSGTGIDISDNLISITNDCLANEILQYNGGVWECVDVDDLAILPVGSDGQTLRHDGTNWVANSNLYNSGANVGIGTASPSHSLDIFKSSGDNPELALNNGTNYWGIYNDRSTSELRFWNGNDLFWLSREGDLKVGQNRDVDLVVGVDEHTNSRICLNGVCIDSWDDSPVVELCGNGRLDSGEQCDGDILPASCSSLGYIGGSLTCTPACIFDTHSCSSGDRKYVFVTGGTVPNSSMTSGVTQGRIWMNVEGIELVGVDAADKICNYLANNGTKIPASHKPSAGANYKAWLSGENSDGVYQPAEDFSHPSVPYYLPEPFLVTAGEIKVADNWVDLTDMTLNSPINRTENGVELLEERVWAGTNGDGRIIGGPENCCGDNWDLLEDTAYYSYLGYGKTSVAYIYWSHTISSSSIPVSTGRCTNNYHLYCFEQ
jgi:hypothetical protein